MVAADAGESKSRSSRSLLDLKVIVGELRPATEEFIVGLRAARAESGTVGRAGSVAPAGGADLGGGAMRSFAADVAIPSFVELAEELVLQLADKRDLRVS